MFGSEKIIDAFRKGALEIDCSRMVLTQNKAGGEFFEGQGYIRQSDDGALIFKIYVTKHNAKPLIHLESAFSAGAGKLFGDEAFYNLEAAAHNQISWTAARILPVINWGATDIAVLVEGQMQSIATQFELPQPHHYLRLHFFEEHEIPCLEMSKMEDGKKIHYVRDRAQFRACSCNFDVRKREGSGDTIIELTSDTELPIAFDLRIQEALQYIVAKSAFWRARLRSQNTELHLELSSPWRKSARTRLLPPISSTSGHFLDHGWRLFEKYLAYVNQKTSGTHWNPIAYHLYNACETTANSVDACAVGISVAVEALAGLIVIDNDGSRAKEIASYQRAALEWLVTQQNLSEGVAKQARGQIESMGNRRPKETLLALADAGRVEREYVRAWEYLRNRHVHPKLKDLDKPTSLDMQKLLDHIHKVEVLLRQLTFHLIEYEGPFTDYGVHGFPSKQYPLAVEDASAEVAPQ